MTVYGGPGWMVYSVGQRSARYRYGADVTGRPNQVQVEAVAFSAYAQQRPLDWDVPMRELMQNREAGEFTWRRLQYVFELPDPHNFRKLDFDLEDGDVELLRRFVDQARTLAGASLLGAQDTMRVSFDDFTNAEHVETELSPPDVTTGFMVLMRQCYADGEEASFSKAWKLLNKALHEHGDEKAVEVLKQWKKAHGKLKRMSLEELVQEQMVEDKLMPGDSTGPDGKTRSAIVRDPASPGELLLTLWYGGQIHWGKHRQAVAAIQGDAFESARTDMAVRRAVVDFAHVYIGFAVLVERALGLTHQP